MREWLTRNRPFNQGCLGNAMRGDSPRQGVSSVAGSTAARGDIRICRLQLWTPAGVPVFSRLGDIVNRTWLVILIGWVAALVALRLTAPDWNQVARDGEFSFLPADVPSRRAE